MLSVYTRHHPDCKNAGDKTWRRCGCPKWIWGSLNGKFIRQSTRTPLWERAEELRLRLSQGELPPALPAKLTEAATNLAPPPLLVQGQSPGEILTAAERPRITLKKAVEAYLADALSRNVSEATLDKL
jgi:hypothetical protein